MSEKKYITPETHLKAFALFTMAHDHYRKMREFERALFALLGHDTDYGDHLSDEIYNDAGADFERGLARDGYEVKK